MASLVFWKQSTNSASEGGRARSVRTPSAGAFFPFFFPFLRWFSCLNASAAFCSRATNHSMSSRAQLRICCGRGGVSGRPALQGQPHRCPSARVRPGPTYRLLLYLLSQHGPRRLLVQRLPTAEACGVRGAG